MLLWGLYLKIESVFSLSDNLDFLLFHPEVKKDHLFWATRGDLESSLRQPGKSIVGGLCESRVRAGSRVQK